MLVEQQKNLLDRKVSIAYILIFLNVSVCFPKNKQEKACFSAVSKFLENLHL